MWYNGDWNFFNGLANEVNTQVSDAYVFSDFFVPNGAARHIVALFSRDLMSFTTTQASFEIRPGVSTGNGGTLLFSGTAAATQVATGRSGLGFNEFTIQISGLCIELVPGHYWLNVAPIGEGSGRSFNSTTDGANAVCNPPGNNGMDFFRSNFFGANYVPTDDPMSVTDTTSRMA